MKTKTPRIVLDQPMPLPIRYATDITADKAFPLQRGDILLVRSAQGKVTTRIDVRDGLIVQNKAHYDALVTEYQR